MVALAHITLCVTLFSLRLVSSAPLEKRATTLANGSGMKTGNIGDKMKWQSSGILERGNCPSKAKISDCYRMRLAARGNLERRSLPLADAEAEVVPTLASSVEDSTLETSSSQGLEIVRRATTEKQRIELLSWPPAPKGSQWRYKWRSYLEPSVSSGLQFFHLFQLFSRDVSRPIITLSIKNGEVGISHTGKCNLCTKIPLSRLTGRTIRHDLRVTYGSLGVVSYAVVDVNTGKTLLKYGAVGNMPGQTTPKFGMYRAAVAGLTSATSYVGDFYAER